VLVGQDVAGWIVGLVIGLTSVMPAAVVHTTAVSRRLRVSRSRRRER